MKKKIVTLLCATAMAVSLLAGCGSSAEDKSASDEQAETPEDEEEPADAVVSDQEAADNVAALIDAIYVDRKSVV